MDARLNNPGTPIAANFGKYLKSAGKAVTGSSLPAATQALVKIQASQINSCAAHAGMRQPGLTRPRTPSMN